VRWVGYWILSFFPVLAIGLIEAVVRINAGESRGSAVDEGVSTIKALMILSAIFMAGLWMVLNGGAK
jgi:hypothetical protein